MVDRCVCCGDIIPEGSMVCSNCQKKYQSDQGRAEPQTRNQSLAPPCAGSQTAKERRRFGGHQ